MSRMLLHHLQAVQEELTSAEAAQAAARSRLEAVKARLPQPAPPPAVPSKQQEQGSTPDPDETAGSFERDEDDAGEAGKTGTAAVPPLDLQQLVAAEPHEVVLSPEQRRALTEAQAALGAADAECSAARAAASSKSEL